jgi:inhibitor of KinA
VPELQCTAYGPDALLLTFAARADDAAFRRARALVRALAQNPPPGLREVVPAYTTLLLLFDPGRRAELPALGHDLARRLGGVDAIDLPPPTRHVIPVIYDGPDLARLAAGHGLTPAEVIARHTAPVYRVHLLGFAPGFAYLGGLDPVLHTPRLPTPRPRVPAGSVGIGGEQTGIYPLATPGGWNLIGRTHTTLFDPSRGAAGHAETMFLLQPGDEVRFTEVPA